MPRPPPLHPSYPWTTAPILIAAPMRLISLPSLAVSVSRAQGLGFLGAGSGDDLHSLSTNLDQVRKLLASDPIPGTLSDTLPIGIGFIVWDADLSLALAAVKKYRPAAVWLFAPQLNEDLVAWTRGIREASGGVAKVWIQIGTVADAAEVVTLCRPDVLVVQGSDAGGHGLQRGAGIVTLLPEVADALRDAGLGDSIPLVAAGGIVEGRGVAACLALGASGIAMGTRFLACGEAQVARGYRDAVLSARDGGVETVRTRVYDELRGTKGWPVRYGGRGVANRSFVDAGLGMRVEENRRLYQEALGRGDEGWGMEGRLTTYAGTGVGLVREVMTARDILEEIRGEVEAVREWMGRGAEKL